MKSSKKLLISACLLGQPVRYDGKSKPIEKVDWLALLQRQQRLVVICPEVAGGLSTPRPPAEQRGESVITVSGENVTQPFHQGASQALTLCQQHGITFALLKANSPSCGNERVYDGSFSGTLIDGMGMTAKLLKRHNIQVFNEHQLQQLHQELTAAGYF